MVKPLQLDHGALGEDKFSAICYIVQPEVPKDLETIRLTDMVELRQMKCKNGLVPAGDGN
jgi:hypothetical protein